MVNDHSFWGLSQSPEGLYWNPCNSYRYKHKYEYGARRLVLTTVLKEVRALVEQPNLDHEHDPALTDPELLTTSALS